MKIAERLLLIFMTLVILAVFACIGICAWNAQFLGEIVELIQSSILCKIIVTAVLLIFAVLQIRLIFVGMGKWNKGSALAAATEEGGIYINLDTISALAERAVKKVECVHELRIKTFMSKEGANICIKVSLAPEAIIPDASAEVQQSVKGDIEALCGIKVNKVLVQVDNSLQAQK